MTTNKKTEHAESDLKENLWEFVEKVKDKAIDLEEWLEKLWFIKDILWSDCLTELANKVLSNSSFWQILWWIFIVFGWWGVLSIFGHWHHLFKEILFMLVWWITLVQWLWLVAAKKWTSILSLTNVLAILLSVILWLFMYQKFVFDGLGTTLWLVIISFVVLLLVIKSQDKFVK